MTTYNILHRKLIEVNTDQQRRCYNGCHYESELQWTQWAVLEYEVTDDSIKRRLEFWRELNDYAISARGESARSEFKMAESVNEQ